MEFDVALILINNEAAHALDCSSTFIPSTKLNKAINHDFVWFAAKCEVTEMRVSSSPHGGYGSLPENSESLTNLGMSCCLQHYC